MGVKMKMPQIAQRIRAEAKKTHKWELGSGGRDQERMLEAWAEMRPRMLTALKIQGVEKDLARLLEERAMEQMAGSLARQLSPTDAQEQAERDWYLIEPEEGPTETELEAVLDRVEMGGLQQ